MRAFSFLVVGAMILASAPAASAALILQPAAASGPTSSGSPDNTRNQTGLSTGYTSLVTDFDTYIASNPAHNSFMTTNLWVASGLPADLDFDLGGTFTIESFALWTRGSDHGFNVSGFELLADDNAGFSSPTSLGLYVANPNTGPFFAVLPEVFTFAPTSAAFVRMRITSTLGSFALVGEAAFEVQGAVAVPEPATALCGLIGLATLAVRRRRAA